MLSFDGTVELWLKIMQIARPTLRAYSAIETGHIKSLPTPVVE